MVLGQQRRAVGKFTNRQDAERALDELNRAGFSNTRMFVVANAAEPDLQLDETGMTGMSDRFKDKALEERATAGTITGTMLGAIGGCLVGLGVLSVPGIGLAVAVGTSGTALASTLAGAGIGAASGGLLDVLGGLGTSEDQYRVERERFSDYEYLVTVDGTSGEVRRAQSILDRSY